jgi:hypothetical protein
MILKRKTTPLSQEESEFTQMYENVICMHVFTMFTSIPSCLYYFAYYNAVQR